MEIRRVRVLLIPTKKQEEDFRRYINYFRWTYNLGIEWCRQNYTESGLTLKYEDLSSMLTVYKKTHVNFYEVDSHTLKEAMRNVGTAYKNFFAKTGEFPQFKSYKTARDSFYTRQDKLKVTKNTVQLSSIGEIKSKSCHWLLDGLIKSGKAYKMYKPYVVYDNKYWYLSFGVEVELEKEVLSEKTIGIDIGVKTTIVTSEDERYGNINKTKKVEKLKKRKKRYQKKLSKKYNKNKKGNKYIKTENIKKLEQKIRLIERKLKNIRENYMHEILNKIVRQLPQQISIEDLDVKRMMKNKHLALAIQEQSFRRLRELLVEKCKNSFITLVVVDRYYGSSKTCSRCGWYKKDLKLGDRIYVCKECGLEIDRDLNAAINIGVWEKKK